MVLLTAVPVSGPFWIGMGVMVATRAFPAADGAPPGNCAWARPWPWALGAVRSGTLARPADSAVGAGKSEADISVSSPNRLSMLEQAVRLRPAAMANARNRPDLSLVVTGNTLISTLRCRRRRP